MATYKISFLINDSYSSKSERYVSDVADEYDAVEKMINQDRLDTENLRILSVDFICE